MNNLRSFEKKAATLTKKELDIRFWERCLDLKLCPEFLKFKPPKLKQYDNVERIYLDIVKKSLTDTRREMDQVKRELDTLKDNIFPKLSSLEKENLEVDIQTHCEKYKKEVLATHNRKLLNLWIKQRPRSPDCIINDTNRKLSVEERNVLYRGLKHHILPKRINGYEIKASIEKTCDRIVDKLKEKDTQDNKGLLAARFINDTKWEIQCITRNFLNAAKHVCSSRANQSFHRALKQLATDKSISVTKFDKGNGICILNTDDYLSKLDQIVGDTTKFKVVVNNRKNARHPIYRRMEKVRDDVQEHLGKLLTKEEVKYLSPSGCGTGRLYGTTKVHKADKPVRPIVSMVNTPEYRLAKYLDKTIKPFIPSKYSIASNAEFMQKLKDLELHEGDYCMSFDIVSLFTNVPLEETISIVANSMEEQQSAEKSLSKAGIIALLKRATGGIFTHRNQLYQQEDGVAMSNPLAPTLANFFLGHLENSLFQENADTSDQPVFYTRYVDDIFCVFRKDCDYRRFHSKLNALHNNLEFTYEMGGTSMPFLDTSITLKQDGIRSTVYRKPTNTNVLLNNTAVAPSSWKTGLLKCLLHRAEVVCSDDQARNEEHDKLKSIFHMNGYPDKLFDSIKQKFNGKTTNCHDDSSRQVKELEERPIVFQVPYLGKISVTFAKRLGNLLKTSGQNIRIVYKTTKVQDSFNLKEPIPKAISSKIVYKFTCRSDPATNYIGFTNRTLRERVREHVGGSTAISDHISICKICNDEGVSIDDFQIIKRCRYKTESSIYEALAIREQNPKLNRNLVKPGKTFNLKLFN